MCSYLILRNQSTAAAEDSLTGLISNDGYLKAPPDATPYTTWVTVECHHVTWRTYKDGRKEHVLVCREEITGKIVLRKYYLKPPPAKILPRHGFYKDCCILLDVLSYDGELSPKSFVGRRLLAVLYSVRDQRTNNEQGYYRVKNFI